MRTVRVFKSREKIAHNGPVFQLTPDLSSPTSRDFEIAFYDEQKTEHAHVNPHLPHQSSLKPRNLIGHCILLPASRLSVANAKNLGGVVWSIKQITFPPSLTIHNRLPCSRRRLDQNEAPLSLQHLADWVLHQHNILLHILNICARGNRRRRISKVAAFALRHPKFPALLSPNRTLGRSNPSFQHYPPDDLG